MDEHFKSKIEQVPKLALNRIETALAISQSPATVDRLTKRGLLHPCRATRRPLYAIKEIERFLKRQPPSRIGEYETLFEISPPAFRATTGANQRGAQTWAGNVGAKNSQP